MVWLTHEKIRNLYECFKLYWKQFWLHAAVDTFYMPEAAKGQLKIV